MQGRKGKGLQGGGTKEDIGTDIAIIVRDQGHTLDLPPQDRQAGSGDTNTGIVITAIKSLLGATASSKNATIEIKNHPLQKNNRRKALFQESGENVARQKSESKMKNRAKMKQKLRNFQWNTGITSERVSE